MVLSSCSLKIHPAVSQPHSGTARLPFDLPLDGVYRPIIARAAQSHHVPPVAIDHATDQRAISNSKVLRNQRANDTYSGTM